MYRIFHTLLSVFWLFDVLDLSFMKYFDTTIPINTLAWIAIWLVVPNFADDSYINIHINDDKEKTIEKKYY